MPPLPLTGTWSHEMLGVWLTGLLASGSNNLQQQASAVYPAANRILYMPFGLAMPVTILKLWCYNGAAVSGNLNMGIYDVTGKLIVEIGSTVHSGVNVLQVFDIADTKIGPGDFYLAIICDNVTSAFFRIAPAQAGFCQAMGMLQEAGSGAVLPATATFASVASAFVPEIGFSTRTGV